MFAIVIRISSIALFWYTWGKVKPNVHIAIGFIMAVSGFAAPFGFRYIFAEITSPHGVAVALQGSPDSARLQVFLNPLYPPLILHTVVGAMSVGGFITASFFAIKGNTSPKFFGLTLARSSIPRITADFRSMVPIIPQQQSPPTLQ
ncbi:hypothetical protein HRbin02_01854 [Candidatus Calditenuaceae archaeon HR02]|nr:hypothetical protein HRbin02_01854 [Candidatus Calditenuaceae archaeon HR02]